MAKYSLEFKLQIVTEYLSGKGNHASLAKKYQISSTTRIHDWVEMYKTFGVDGLSGKKGRPAKMESHKKQTETIKEIQTDEQTEYVKQLEKELLHLRIENAYLKELRRLRLEDARKQKELQESSKVSAKNSN